MKSIFKNPATYIVLVVVIGVVLYLYLNKKEKAYNYSEPAPNSGGQKPISGGSSQGGSSDSGWSFEGDFKNSSIIKGADQTFMDKVWY